jgi:hypothetical protein
MDGVVQYDHVSFHSLVVVQYDCKFQGSWSDDSPLWTKYPEVAEVVGFKKINDGMFYMPFDDFATIFDKVNLQSY